MENKYDLTAVIIAALAGLIAGFLLSPAKGGFGNYCGNTVTLASPNKKKSGEKGAK